MDTLQEPPEKTPAEILTAAQGYTKLCRNDALRTGNAVLDTMLHAQRAEAAAAAAEDYRNRAMAAAVEAEHYANRARIASHLAVAAAVVATAVACGAVLALAYGVALLALP